MQAIDRLIMARSSLIMRKPGIGSMAFGMKFVEAPWHPTAATDGRHMYYNAGYVDSLSDLDVRQLVEHETWHNARGHPWRKGDAIHLLANIAMDITIDGDILAEDGVYLHGLINPEYTGWSWEAIYADLLDKGQSGDDGSPDDAGDGSGSNGSGSQKPSHVGNFTGRPGEVLSPPPDTANEDEAGWVKALDNAAKIEAKRGNMSSPFRKLHAEQRHKVDWRALTLRFCQSVSGQDYTWRKPSRRYGARGMYLPAIDTDKRIPVCVVAIDISGSTAAYQSQFGAEMKHIVEVLQPDKTIVLYVDCEVKKVVEFERGDIVIEHIGGYGGTDFRPAFQWVEDNGIEPAFLCYLTDLEGDSGEAPDYPVLWVSTTAAEAPYGETVRIE